MELLYLIKKEKGEKMLNFILGRAGSGKTELLYDIMGKYAQDKEIILIVPEQFSFEAEKQVYRKFGAKKAKNIKVLSFTRLSYDIFKLYGGAKTVLSDMQKQLLMAVTLNELKDELKVYNSYKKNTAFVKSMVETLDDLKSAGADSKDIENISKICNEKELKEKLSDLSEIYTAYNAVLGKNGADPKDNLKKAIRKAVEGKYFKDKIIFIDSFMAFSPVEHNMLSVMTEDAAAIYGAFCTLGFNDKSQVFEPVNKTITKMRAYARENNLEVDVQMAENSFKTSALNNIERYFLTDDEISGERLADGINLYEAKNPYDEVLNIAAAIKELVCDKGYKYKEIAVITRELSPYEKILPRVFRKFDIPYYMDSRKDISDMPLIVGLNAFLNCSVNGLTTENLIKCAKSPLSPLEGVDSSKLENYCYMWSIKSDEWKQDFTANPSGISEELSENDIEELKEINGFRKAVYEPVRDFVQKIRDTDGRSYAMAIYELLDSLNAYDKILEFASDMPEEKQNEYKSLQKSAWDNFMDILDIFANLIGDTKMSAIAYGELMQLCLDNCDLGQIPQTLDHVIVGKADRIRPDNVRAVFVIGCIEGVFPAEISSGGILSDNDRGKIQNLGLNLTADVEERETYECYYAYFALTRPSEKLYVSYPVSELNGSENRPSVIYTEVKRISGAEETEHNESFYSVWNTDTAIESLSENYDNEEYKTVLEDFISEDENRTEILKKLEIAREKPCHQIKNTELAQNLFGKNMRISPSKLDNFYSCKFSYFSQNALKIRKRQKVDVSAVETGKLIHYIMEKMINPIYSKEKNFTELTDDERDKLVKKYLDEYMNENIGNANLNSRIKYLFERIGDNMTLIMKHLSEELSQSKFKPVYFEEKIGLDGRIKSVPIKCNDGSKIVVEGVVDRIDCLVKNGKKYYRVVDYKTGRKNFSEADVYYGLNMQMLIYLFAICPEISDNSDVLPAGVLYMPSKNVISSVDSNSTTEEILKTKNETMKMNGIILDDNDVIAGMEREAENTEGKSFKCVYIPVTIKKDGTLGSDSSVANLAKMRELKDKVEENIKKMCEILHSGNIEAVPTVSAYKVDPCEYCIYKTACGHRAEDKKIFVRKQYDDNDNEKEENHDE